MLKGSVSWSFQSTLELYCRHCLHIQILYTDHIVLIGYLSGDLMQVIFPLIGCYDVTPCQAFDANHPIILSLACVRD